MINAEKIIFSTQTYHTPAWNGTVGVKIIKLLSDGKVLVKTKNHTFVRKLNHMYSTSKEANIGRRAWEHDERKRKKKKK